MTKIEAIQLLLKYSSSQLAELYKPCMEVQVNVAPDGGNRVTTLGRQQGYSDGVTTWSSFRIPTMENGEPRYYANLNWDLEKHAEAIGLSGWDWENKLSHWVGFDIDSIQNHSVGLIEEELARVRDQLSTLGFGSIYRSTSGKGYHFYVFFSEPVQTATRSHHAALARSILTVMEYKLGTPLKKAIDVCGAILWVHHRKQEGTNGLSLCHNGGLFDIKDVPSNWSEHVQVVSGSSRKIKCDDEEIVEGMKKITLTESHRKVIDWVTKNGKRNAWYDTDHTMLVCHTCDLRDCNVALEIQVPFETNSKGLNTEQNCFALPMPDGSFIVRRYGKGTKECDTWYTDPNGYTTTTFGRLLSTDEAVIASSMPIDSRGQRIFETYTYLKSVLERAGHTIPPFFDNDRKCAIVDKSSEILIKIVRNPEEPDIEGYITEKNYYTIRIKKQGEDSYYSTPDHLIRHLASDKSIGWFVKISRSNQWVETDKSNIANVIVSQYPDIGKPIIDAMLGNAVLDPWRLVNKPFDDEFTGDREWNKQAAKLQYRPIEGSSESWWSIFNHLGRELDHTVANDSWCRSQGILTGGDYLFIWCAYMFQYPEAQLPYLFFYGRQNCGKSTFHEALSLLFYREPNSSKYIGFVRANNALTSATFNGELYGAVLCVVEELQIARNSSVAGKMKDWVTGKTISIRDLGKTAFEATNTSHWVHTANHADHCPVFPGDTRIVVIRVNKLEEEIPWGSFKQRLINEAPAILHEFLSYKLPLPCGRLQIPVLETSEKREMMIENESLLERFLSERCYYCAGNEIPFTEFFITYQNWLSRIDPRSAQYQSSHVVARKWPENCKYVKGRSKNNITSVGNMSFSTDQESLEYHLILDDKGRLIRSDGK